MSPKGTYLFFITDFSPCCNAEFGMSSNSFLWWVPSLKLLSQPTVDSPVLQNCPVNGVNDILHHNHPSPNTQPLIQRENREDGGEGVPSSSSTIEYYEDTFEGYKEWPAINQKDYNIQIPQIILPHGIPHSTFTFHLSCIFLLALLSVWIKEGHFCANLQWPWSILPTKPHSSPISTPPSVILFPK